MADPQLAWFDGHLDLTYLALHGRDLAKPPAEAGGTLQPASVTFPSLRAANVRAAVSTIFVRKRTPEKDGEFCYENEGQAFASAMRQIALHRAWQRTGWIENASLDQDGPRRKRPAGAVAPLRVFMALEGAACVGELVDMDMYYTAGVRMVALAWAEGTKWAGGDKSGGDITPEGRQLIDRMDALGVIHDVSHLSEQAFWTLLECARGPVVASHSNCRSLLPGAAHPERHLSDKQIQALANREEGGARIGINLYAKFLVPADTLQQRRATIADVVKHLTHMENIAGRRDFLTLGSDMDSGFGTDLLPRDLQGPGDLIHLAEALSAAGWSDAEIKKFACGWKYLLGE